MKQLEFVLRETLELAEGSTSSATQSQQILADQFSKGLNISTFLCASSLWERARPTRWHAAPTESLRQLSAKLHVYAGMNLDSPWPTTEDGRSCPHAPNHEGIIRRGMFDDMEDSEEEYEQTPDTEENRMRLRDHPTPIRDVHPWARARVYDLRRYKQSNYWGPFTDDFSQSIDWEKVQSIMIILAFNHKLYSERRGFEHLHLNFPPLGISSSSRLVGSASATTLLRSWGERFNGIAENSYVSTPLEGTPKPSPYHELDALDPYGVTGTWMRIVCFLDYNDLYRINFERGSGIPSTQERDPITTREAFRLIKLKLHVTKIEEQEGVLEETGERLLPVVHFQGTSRSETMNWDPNANSRIRGTLPFPPPLPFFPLPSSPSPVPELTFRNKGTVHQTPSGSIRWTSFSIFHGEERWRSEGVQIGGLKSARGILGNWFDKDFDVHGPAGPTAFWKISDLCIEEERRGGGAVQIFLE
jgi:hypothetical protein